MWGSGGVLSNALPVTPWKSPLEFERCSLNLEYWADGGATGLVAADGCGTHCTFRLFTTFYLLLAVVLCGSFPPTLGTQWWVCGRDVSIAGSFTLHLRSHNKYRLQKNSQAGERSFCQWRSLTLVAVTSRRFGWTCRHIQCKQLALDFSPRHTWGNSTKSVVVNIFKPLMAKVGVKYLEEGEMRSYSPWNL